MADDKGSTNDEESQTGDNQSRNDERQTKLEVLLDVLTSRRRRYALYYLQDHEVTDLNSLAKHLASVEQDVSVSSLSDDQTTNIRTQLLHTDLPALEDAQLLEFDRRSEAVRYSEPPPLLKGLLWLCAEIDAPNTQLD